MDKMKMETANKTLEKLEILKEMFPEVITETKDANGDIVSAVDAKKLEQLLSTKVIEGDECYDFTWVGKKQAMVEANRPIRKTLRPCKEESVDWENTENLYIEGDNLDVLKLLQESYLNKIKMIYIDPPYNTGNDSFIYPDDYKTNKDQYDEEVGAIDESGYRMFKNTKDKGRFHSSWCSMMYSRLKLARNLLTDDGVIFISIDDNEVDNIKKICSEIFGEYNFIASLIWNKQHSQQQGLFKRYHESILVYSKDIKNLKNICGGEGIIDAGALKKISSANPESEFNFPAGVRFEAKDGTSITGTFGDSEKVTVKKGTLLCKNGKTAEPVILSAGWTQKNQMIAFFNGEEVYDTKGQKVLEFYFSSTGKLKCKKERTRITPPTILPEYGMVSEQTEALSSLMNCHAFDMPKPVEMIKDFCQWFLNKDSIILDFFSGSATTAHAVMQLNAEDGGKRKFIMVQLPEVCDEKSEAYKAGYTNICEIGKERIRRAGKKIVEETGKQDLDIGFRVLKLNESNMKDVYYAPADYNQSMLDKMTSNIKEDRTPEDLLYACMLEWGLELSLPHKVENIAGYNVHIVNDGDLIACFDNRISEEAIKQIADKKPLRAVFRDSSFASDAARVNVGEIFKLKSPNTTIKVI